MVGGRADDSWIQDLGTASVSRSHEHKVVDHKNQVSKLEKFFTSRPKGKGMAKDRRLATDQDKSKVTPGIRWDEGGSTLE